MLHLMTWDSSCEIVSIFAMSFVLSVFLHFSIKSSSSSVSIFNSPNHLESFPRRQPKNEMKNFRLAFFDNSPEIQFSLQG